jgi:hypothetical protein
VLSENRRVSPVQEATYDGEGPEELLLTIGRRPRETHVRLGSKADVGPPLRLCPLYHRKRTFDCPLCAISKRAHHFRLGLLHPSKGTEHALTGYPGEVGVCRFLCIIDMETPGGINLPPANSITHISVVSRNALDAFGQ